MAKSEVTVSIDLSRVNEAAEQLRPVARAAHAASDALDGLLAALGAVRVQGSDTPDPVEAFRARILAHVRTYQSEKDPDSQEALVLGHIALGIEIEPGGTP